MKDWLSASWADYRRRWLPLGWVLLAGAIASVAVVLIPLMPAAIAAYSLGSPWWLLAGWSLSVLGVMGVSTWAQAAAIRAAANDEDAGSSLRRAWGLTPGFAWVLSLAMLAAGGGFVLLIVPGLVLGVLLFFAPFYQLSGEESGMGAVELSWARVRPCLGAASGRLGLLAAIAWLSSLVPWIGWLLGMLWAPFALVACARLAEDLKASNPAPARPRLGAAIAALSAVLLLAAVGVTWGAGRAAFALSNAYASGALPLPDPETAQAMVSVLKGGGTDEERQRSTTYVLTLSSAALQAGR